MGVTPSQPDAVERLAKLLRDLDSEEPFHGWTSEQRAKWLLARGVHVGELSAEPTEAMIEAAAVEIGYALDAVDPKGEYSADMSAARTIAGHVLRAALRASVPPSVPEGLWTECCGPSLADSAPWRVQAVIDGHVRNIPLESEIEALAVRDALNRVASVPPQEGREK